MNDSHLTRRQVLAGAAGTIGGLTLVSSCSKPAKREQAGAVPGGFKIGVCDWTIGKMANPASLEAARGIGLDGVQVDFGRGEDDLPLFDKELQQRFIRARDASGMQIASLALGVLNNIPYKSDPRAERWVSGCIDVCKTLDVDIVLLAFFGDGDLRDDKAGTDTVVERLRKVAPRAEDAGVTLAVESWLSADEHVDIIKRVGSPAIKVYYDVANSNKVGHDIYAEIRQLGSLIAQFHAKDYDDLYGKGSIDFKRVRAVMDDIGYRDWFVMEGTKMPLGVEESCRYDADYLRTIFPRKV